MTYTTEKRKAIKKHHANLGKIHKACTKKIDEAYKIRDRAQEREEKRFRLEAMTIRKKYKK